MTITLITASFLGLLWSYLTVNVVKNRFREKVSIGDGDNKNLQNAIRAHGNLTEYAPIVLILIGLLEYREVNDILLMVLAATFVVARYMHGLTFGKIEGKNLYRMWGMTLTFLVMLIASVLGLLEGYRLL